MVEISNKGIRRVIMTRDIIKYGADSGNVDGIEGKGNKRDELVMKIAILAGEITAGAVVVGALSMGACFNDDNGEKSIGSPC